MDTQCSKVRRMVLPSLLVFPFRGMPLCFATMTEGARIRYVKPGRKAGTDRRNTVGTTVTERIPEGRTARVCARHVRVFRLATSGRVASGDAERQAVFQPSSGIFPFLSGISPQLQPRYSGSVIRQSSELSLLTSCSSCLFYQHLLPLRARHTLC